MNYQQPIVLLFLSTLTLFGCTYLPGVEAQAPKFGKIAKASVLPSQPSAAALAAPLTYQIESYTSQAMGGNRSYGISLPPGYQENPHQHYPVIFLLHGGHGNPNDWFNNKKGAALHTLQQLYASGKLSPSIVITPDGNDKRGSSPYWDPQYFDGPNGKVSTAIGDELVKVVQSRYRLDLGVHLSLQV
ncbi:MAG: alpha/beta hydrolase-fold protein [Nostocaceae cyanobacterium]|nr:alpha/beta hydrolase-fold protein [Nostocaceae cyanobacterium]